MTLLVVGLSHRSAPVDVLERTTVPADEQAKVLHELQEAEAIGEVLLLSTCNRVEVYADVLRFHPAVAEITGVLARRSGLGVADLGAHLYVHFDEAAVEHLFSVATGLDSMILGESQILGQVRVAYGAAVEAGAVRTVLHEAAQTALRVGKRAHAETGIDRAGASVVSVALDHAERVLGTLSGRRVLVVGAGSMGALAGAALRRRGVDDIVVANRTRERADRLATTLHGRAVALADVTTEIVDADVVVSSTGATGLVLGDTAFGPRGGRSLVVLDLALPRDVDRAVADLPGVTYLDLDALRADGATVADADLADAARIVADELADYLSAQQRLSVAPTVTALRSRANEMIDVELARLDARLPALDEVSRAEVADTVRRVVEKVLHAPTVRVKELASTPGGDRYEQALRELFDLDPAAAESVAELRSARQ